MTKKDKELLFKDLSARLPYGVKAIVQQTNCLDSVRKISEKDIYSFRTGIPLEEDYGQHDYYKVVVTDIKPYLFPLSSMTEEIMDEIYTAAGVYDINRDSSVHIEAGTTFEDLTKIFDILHKHHIDYRGFIPMGLAIDATGLNIY